MDKESCEQHELSESQIEAVKKYLKEGESYYVLYFQGEPILVEPPTFMILAVKSTVPGVKGNTAQGGATKPAELETGLVIQIPLFISEGEKVKVDTREDKYVERIDS